VGHCIDRSVFEERYANDDTGAPAIDPVILLKIVLFAYSCDILSSRPIARRCEENVIFMALSVNTRLHFTTITNFISSIQDVIAPLFRDVLTVCYTDGSSAGGDSRRRVAARTGRARRLHRPDIQRVSGALWQLGVARPVPPQP
jgi:hypothetical protein